MANRLRVRVAKEAMTPCRSLPGSGFGLSCASVAAKSDKRSEGEEANAALALHNPPVPLSASRFLIIIFL